jgi:hypothetical protein
LVGLDPILAVSWLYPTCGHDVAWGGRIVPVGLVVLVPIDVVAVVGVAVVNIVVAEPGKH